MPTIQTMIGKRKIDFLGHLARKPPESLERKVLFSYLTPENEQPAHKRGHTLRYQYWNLLEEIRKLADFESQNWSTKWLDLAAEADGITWRTLRKKWWQHQIKKDNEDTWAIRHAPGGARDQKLAKAPARAEAAYGATPGPNGLYTCPHCGFSMLLRSLKKHILPCKNLPDDQRALLQARRDQRAAKKPPPAAAAQAPHPADHNPAASQSRNRPNRLRRRLNGKQPAPSLRNPKRQMCAQELPAPPPPRGWPPTKCHFCLQEFENKTKCVKHTCSCKKMPYKLWIARVKKVQDHVTVLRTIHALTAAFSFGQHMLRDGIRSCACRDVKPRTCSEAADQPVVCTLFCLSSLHSSPNQSLPVQLISRAKFRVFV